MTIEDAIQHCKEVAEENRQYALDFARVNIYDSARTCQACAAEHEQLAEWLTELKQRREADSHESPKTNGDRIRQLTDVELVESIGLACKRCVYRSDRVGDCADQSCTEGNLSWLRQEVDTNDVNG